jgi:DNA-binding response OmpR family regulator
MIVLVEDDVAIGRAVSQGLTARGHPVRWLRQSAGLAEVVDQEDVAVVVLDLGLPDADGFEVCRALRAGGHDMPVLMLTARGALDDRLEGFAAGADDYLAKPFAFAELAARVAVLARRAAQLPPPPVEFAGLTLDQASGVLRQGDMPLAGEPRSLALLGELVRARGAVVARGALIDAVWGRDAVVSDNTLDVAISALRRRLAEVAPGLAVRAVRGQGLQLEQRA